jgi:SAM-dependent methyltransferase
MDGANADRWSGVADTWSELWGPFSAPARAAIIAATGIGVGTRVLDVGCGAGEFVAEMGRLGAVATGIDPARAMVELAKRRSPDADIRDGEAEHLPWPDASFDVVTAVNALQFAEDTIDALTEFARVTVPGGFIAISNWAERARNDLDTIEQAVAAADGEEVLPDGDLRPAGGIEAVLTEAGFEVVESGLVETPWEAPDDATLVRGVLMGEDPATIDRLAADVIDAARPFRTATGGYRLVNAFRYAVARTP